MKISQWWPVWLILVSAVFSQEPISPRPDIPTPSLIQLEEEWDSVLKERYQTLPDEQRPSSETEWVEFIAPKYEASTEYVLIDRTRVDLLNREYAFEVDWADKSLKWAEAIGQAGWYAHNTHRKPAVLLLVPNKEEGTMRNIYRCRTTCELYKVAVFVEDLTKYTRP
jgi:hypothetical protein